MTEQKGPALFTPEWHAARRVVMDEIARSQQRNGVVWTVRDRARSAAALNVIHNPEGTIGYADAVREYRRAG